MDILRVKVNGEWTDIPAVIGPDGITFIPSVDSQGNLSWSNTGGQPNPPTVNIKGPQGQAGRDGATGQTGVAGTTFIPYVASNGDISWSNADGKPNPATVNIKGPAGANGQNGTNGTDGVSPTITVLTIAGGHRLTIADADHPQGQTVDVMDGADGDNGRGVSSVAKTGTSGLVDTYTITYTDGMTSTFTVTNGQNGTDGATFTPAVSAEGVISWTNDGGKTNPQLVNIKGPPGSTPIISIGTVSTLEPGQNATVTKSGTDEAPVFSFGIPKGEPGDDYILTAQDKADIAAMVDAPVQDVQVNGTSVLQDGVANVPIASGNTFGVIKVGNGLTISSEKMVINPATSALIKEGSATYLPVTPIRQHQATFYGLAKAAGDTTQSQSSNAVGAYTDEAKVAIQKMLGVYRELELIAEVTVGENSERFEVTTDISGQPFALSKMLVRVWLQPSTTGTADFMTATNLAININGINASSSMPTLKYMSNGAATFMEYTSEIMGGVLYAEGAATSVPGSTGSVNKISSASDAYDCIRGFIMSQYSNASSGTSLVPTGTVIKIYGIRI